MDSTFLVLQRNIARGQIILWSYGKGFILVSPQLVYRTINCNGCIDLAEEADSQEQLEYDEEHYSQLPTNALELRLHCCKAILRQYMAASRRMYEDENYKHWCLTYIVQVSTGQVVRSCGQTLWIILLTFSRSDLAQIPTSDQRSHCV